MPAVSDFSRGASAKFGAYVLHLDPFSVFALVVTVILLFVLSRKGMIILLLCFLILIPSNQHFIIGGVHLFFNRIVILIGLIRVMGIKKHTQEQKLTGGWKPIDTYFLLYVLIRVIGFSLQYLEWSATINQVGFIWDTLGGYFMMRSLIVDDEDINLALKCLGYIFALLAVTMIIEQIYAVNLFGYIGGSLIPDTREDGTFRSSGSFRHPLTVGTVGATAIPLFLLLGYHSKKWFVPAMGIIAATIMTITPRASGALMAYGAGIFALLIWPQRRRMQLIRRTVAFSLLVLNLVMESPVWFLIARIDLTGSSSSYHRAVLIDAFVKHFWEWWLIGTPNHVNWGWSLWDVQNQYVSAGIEGGLGAFTCFIAVIVCGFSMIGNAEKNVIGEHEERCLWYLGAALFSYLVAFIGVNLFDQSQNIYSMLLAMITAYTAPMIASSDLNNEVSS